MGFIPAIIGMIAAKKAKEDQQAEQQKQQAAQAERGGEQGGAGGPGWANFSTPPVEENMAFGGLVTKPTNVALGEDGPEVVMPVGDQPPPQPMPSSHVGRYRSRRRH